MSSALRRTDSSIQEGGVNIHKRRSVGMLGEVHPLVAEAFEEDDGAVVFFELDLNRLFEALPQSRGSVKPLARFPASLRDISILVDSDVPAARIQQIIDGQPLVERAVLFDVYEGDEAPSGKVSLGYRIHSAPPTGPFRRETLIEAWPRPLPA